VTNSEYPIGSNRGLVARTLETFRGKKSKLGDGGEALCRLTADSAVKPPRRLRIEARAHARGFSIWAMDEIECPDGKQVAASTRPYNWRAFAAALQDSKLYTRFVRRSGGSIADVGAIVVDGASELAGVVLVRAFVEAEDWACSWLLAQSDASFAVLEEMTTLPYSRWWFEICEMSETLHEHGLDQDLLTLHRRYGNPAYAPGSFDIEQALESKPSNFLDRLAPFEDEIDLVLRYWEYLTYGGSEDASGTWDTYGLKRFIITYVLVHGCLPAGRRRLVFHNVPTDIDFDSLAAGAASVRALLPGPYRLPRSTRGVFFCDQIDAIVESFDASAPTMPRASRRRRRYWLSFFLQCYVGDYEQLPRGKMLVDFGRLPSATEEVDFDQLRLAAALPEEADGSEPVRSQPRELPAWAYEMYRVDWIALAEAAPAYDEYGFFQLPFQRKIGLGRHSGPPPTLECKPIPKEEWALPVR
jgi:hypothetical protein